MNKITIHTPYRNLELIRVVFGELGIRDGKFSTKEDSAYVGFHLDNPVECVVVETCSVLHINLISRLGAFGPVELDVSGTGCIGIDLSLN